MDDLEFRIIIAMMDYKGRTLHEIEELLHEGLWDIPIALGTLIKEGWIVRIDNLYYYNTVYYG